MNSNGSLWLWRGLWALGILSAVGLIALYVWLPTDGGTGDLASFTSRGFRVQWLLEKREGGLREEDVILFAGGHTVDEWLDGAPRGPEWRTGGVVSYEILRNGQRQTLEIQLAPVPFGAIVDRWAVQLLVALAIFVIGTFVLLRRPQELAARLLSLFCITLTLQYLGDAYNFQYPIIPWRWPFWVQLVYEHLAYSLCIATVCYFTMVFPVRHPLLERHPRLVPTVLYLASPSLILGAMVLSPKWTAAITNGNDIAWIVAITQIGLTMAFGVRSVPNARDPVARTQIKWILWCASLGVAVMLPGYILPLLLTGHPLLPHPVSMILIALIPFTLAFAILHYNLFDINVLINRTLVYGTLTALLGLLYLFLVSVLPLITQAILHTGNNVMVGFIASLGIALAFFPLRRRVQTVIDRTFYRSKLDFQQLLPEMSEKLASSIVLDQLATQLTIELPRRLEIAWAALLVLAPEGKHFELAGSESGQQVLPADHPLFEYLRLLGRPLVRRQPPQSLPIEAQDFVDANAIELSIPLIVGTELIGLYNLGAKLSGNTYSHDEINLLYLLGQQAAIAVENSRLYERAQQEIAERKRAEAMIRASLEEKEVLLKEIHHRVKNNLQVISSLLYLQSRQIQDREALELFEESQHRVRSMALVHERLYQTEDLASVDFQEYVQQLVSYLLRSYETLQHPIRLNANIDPVALDIDTAIPCGLIVNELVSNSLKHAFSNEQEGEILIELNKGPNGLCTLVVGDNGKGLPEDLDFRDTESLGLQLVNTLVHQIEGDIKLDRDSGTRFEITFVDPKYTNEE